MIQAKISQSSINWEITLYDEEIDALVRLTEAGSQIIEIPPISYDILPNNPHEIEIVERQLSDDGHYLLTFFYSFAPFQRDVVITDMQNGESRRAELPELADTEFFVSYLLGAFNPEMTSIAMPYVDYMSGGGIAIVDLDTGVVTHKLNVRELYGLSTAWVNDWTDDGILFAPRCYGCQPKWRYFYRLWDIESDLITRTTIYNDVRNLDRLSTTGDVLYAENNPDFPLGGAGYPPRENVVTFYEENDIITQSSGQVVYYNEAYPNEDPRPRWVKNGEAFLVYQYQDHDMLIFRDGHNISFGSDPEQHFLSVSRDGWFSINREDAVISQFIVSSNSVTEHILYESDASIQITNVQSDIVDDVDLSEFSIEVEAPDVFFCPSALPTQFEIGDWATVTADQKRIMIAAFIESHLDYEDLVWGNHRLESLPIGTQVLVLGHACADGGWAYLRVAYQGRIGWILEIYQTGYHLAPSINPPHE
ncbi:MAG: hypothetical protein Phog2KO_40500 [Phototrophicaceae bacterium]